MDALQSGMPMLYSVLCTLAFRVERQQPTWSNSLIGFMYALYAAKHDELEGRKGEQMLLSYWRRARSDYSMRKFARGFVIFASCFFCPRWAVRARQGPTTQKGKRMACRPLARFFLLFAPGDAQTDTRYRDTGTLGY